jgi:6-phosphogluconolactonase (cycloisomerase 2 family)
MRLVKRASVLLAVMPFLAGCGDFWQAPSSSSSTTTTDSSGVFYVLNASLKEIIGYEIESGTLTAISGASQAFGSAPTALAIAPNGGFLYVATVGSGIYVCAIGSGGSLGTPQSVSGDLASTMQVDPSGNWLVEGGSNAFISAVPISTSTGAATSSTEQTANVPADTINQLVFSPDGNYVFVADGASGTEQISFNFQNADPFGGETNYHVTNSTAGSAQSVAVDPQNRLVYVGEIAVSNGASNTGGLRVFTYGSTLSEITGSPFASAGLAPYSILPVSYGSLAGEYVYVANRTVTNSQTGNIQGFNVTSSTSGSSTTYTLTALSTAASAGDFPVSLAEDSTGDFVIVTDADGNPDLEAYTFDTTTTGQLDSVISSSTGSGSTGANAVAAAP